MRFIHLADVHLGAVPDRGCPWSDKRENEIWETFHRIFADTRNNPAECFPDFIQPPRRKNADPE